MRKDYTKPNSGVKADQIVENQEPEKRIKQKLFISLPMSDRPEEDVLDDLKEIGSKFSENYEVLDNYSQDDDPNGVDRYSGIWYLGNSLKLMRTADLVVFHKDWRSARGCIIEHRVCELYDKPYIELI